MSLGRASVKRHTSKFLSTGIGSVSQGLKAGKASARRRPDLRLQPPAPQPLSRLRALSKSAAFHKQLPSHVLPRLLKDSESGSLSPSLRKRRARRMDAPFLAVKPQRRYRPPTRLGLPTTCGRGRAPGAPPPQPWTWLT